MSVCTSEKITNPLRMVNVDPKSFDHLKDLPFADEFPRGEAKVDVLIGVDFYDLLLCGGVVRGKPLEPVALQTKLGCVLSGVSEWQSLQLTASLANARLEEALSEFQQLWKLELIGIQPEQNSNLTKCEFEAQMCQDKMTHYDRKSKTWFTSPLFKQNPPTLGSNKLKALSILQKVETSTIKNKKVEQVNAAFKEFIEKGFAEEVFKDIEPE